MLDLVSMFGVKKPIIGMIHLAGKNPQEKTRRAIDEIKLYRDNGVNGIIVEDYHGNRQDLFECLNEIKANRKVLGKLALGINTLYNPYSAFVLADTVGGSFVQFDNVNSPVLDESRYNAARRSFPKIAVLGGVRFKYQPASKRTLQQDISEGMSRCEVIVTTGDGTGLETPLEKLRDFRRVMGEGYLFSGAGLSYQNAAEQFSVVDGVIVGSYFKRDYLEQAEADTHSPVKLERVREIVGIRDSLL